MLSIFSEHTYIQITIYEFQFVISKSNLIKDIGNNLYWQFQDLLYEQNCNMKFYL